MPKVSAQERKMLADLVVEKIREEFQNVHMSGNLMNTIYIEFDGDTPRVVIPAQTYNMLKYQREGVLVHTYHGSYASKLNKTGSEFYRYTSNGRKGSRRVEPHNHIGFVENAVSAAIEQWIAILGGKYRVKRKTEI